MSLESQVASLVSAANKLTSEIAGKMKGIDQKVDAATASVPNSIKQESYKDFYIDAVNGNDSNSGSISSPLKTIREASDRSLNISVVNVRLMGGQSFEAEFASSCTRVRFYTYNSSQGIAKIYPKAHRRDDGTYYLRALASNGSFQTVVFHGVHVICGVFPEEALPAEYHIDQFSSNFIFGDQGRDIYLYNCILDIDEISFTGIHAGYASRNLSIGSTQINRINGSSLKLVNSRTSSNPILTIAVSSAVLSGWSNWIELLPVNGNEQNILSNISLS